MLDIVIPGQSLKEERAIMVEDLRTYGSMYFRVHPTILDLMKSLPQLYIPKDVLFFMDYRIFNFLVKA